MGTRSRLSPRDASETIVRHSAISAILSIWDIDFHRLMFVSLGNGFMCATENADLCQRKEDEVRNIKGVSLWCK